jgi:translation initiation factor 4E
MWEVPEHKTGGVWNLRVNKGYANKLWEDLILGLIGEQFTHPNEVTGIVLSTTEQNDRLSVWIRSGNNPSKVKDIKKDILRIMNLPQDVKMDFRQFFPDKGD